MASNYNAVPRIPIVTVYRGQSDLVVERETYQDDPAAPDSRAVAEKWSVGG